MCALSRRNAQAHLAVLAVFVLGHVWPCEGQLSQMLYTVILIAVAITVTVRIDCDEQRTVLNTHVNNAADWHEQVAALRGRARENDPVGEEEHLSSTTRELYVHVCSSLFLVIPL